MSWNLALQINKLASITRVSGSSILIYNSTGTLLASYATTGLFLGDANAGSSSAGSNKLTLPSYGSITWAGISATPPSILTGGGANIYTRAGVAYNQNYAGTEKGQTDFALFSQVITGSVPTVIPLTYNSPIYTINTNSASTNFRLPAVTSGVTPVGTFFIFNNNGGADATIANVSATLLHTFTGGATVKAILLDNSTAPNGTWEITSELPNTVNWGTNGATFSGDLNATGAISGASYTGISATKMILNSTETNGVIEIQKSGFKTGVIQYANVSYPLQITSEGGMSLDTKAGGALNIATTGGAGNINLITNSLTRAVISDTVITLNPSNVQRMYLTSGQMTLGIRNDPNFFVEIDTNVNQGLRFINGTGVYEVQTGLNATGGSFKIGVNGGNGVILAYNANVWGSFSDGRLKENIKPLVGLEKILPLKPVSYNMIASPERINFGFIAQDVLPIIPEIVKEDEWNSETGEKRYTMTQTEILPFAVKAIQEQHAIITDLKAQLASLKATVDALVAQKEILVV
jgi:hypothetical protein